MSGPGSGTRPARIGMDADILRLILFLLGVAVILGIYFWDRHKRINQRVHAIRKAQKETEQESDFEEEKAERVEPLWEPEPEQDSAGFGQEVEPDMDDFESIRTVDESEEMPGRASGEQSSFSFTAEEPEDPLNELHRADMPVMILQLNVISRKGRFSGDDIMRVARDVELEHGDMEIFHRYEGEGARRPVVFSMASMVEPGVFPLRQMSDFSTPGLTLFSQLPGTKDGLAVFSDMLFTAERMAALLDGELQDETHSDLSKQTIEHIREKILEHRRQLQLVRSRSAL